MGNGGLPVVGLSTVVYLVVACVAGGAALARRMATRLLPPGLRAGRRLRGRPPGLLRPPRRSPGPAGRGADDGAEPKVTAIVPAYNEEDTLPATLASLLDQTRPPHQIIVVDDGSTDRTGVVARAMGATVLRPEHNLGSKARAQNHALPWCEGELVLAVDADTVLAPDYLERLLPAFRDPSVAVAAGCVQSRFARTRWERGRAVEYLIGFHWNRPVQAAAGTPMVCSGCCSVFRRDVLEETGGFPERTVVEDMDITWSRQLAGRRAVYVAAAEAWAADPETLRSLRTQVWRWMAGFCQNIRLHGPRLLLRRPLLALWILLALLDVLTAPLWWVTPLLGPLLLHRSVAAVVLWWLTAEIGLTAPVLAWAAKRRRVPLRRALAWWPCLYPMKLVNLYYAWKAVLVELVLVPLGMSRGLTVYHKGRSGRGPEAAGAAAAAASNEVVAASGAAAASGARVVTDGCPACRGRLGAAVRALSAGPVGRFLRRPFDLALGESSNVVLTGRAAR